MIISNQIRKQLLIISTVIKKENIKMVKLFECDLMEDDEIRLES